MIDFSKIIPPVSQTLETEKAEQPITVSPEGQHSEKSNLKTNESTLS
jgi:hypothetical protein